jgi:hypothetical protein
VRAEADNRHHGQQRQCAHRATSHAHPLAPARRSEHDERQHEPRRCLHSHARHDHHRRRAQARGDARGEGQRTGQHEQHERVVVGAGDRQLEQHRVASDEHGRQLRRAVHPLRRACRQRDRREARQDRERLQCPQPSREPQPRQRVAGEREQRAIGRMLERPADEREHRVGGSFGGHVRVRIESVQDAQARKRQVAEHVLGDQRGAEQQGHVCRHDRQRDRAPRQRPRGEEHRRVACAHHERQRLKAARSQLQAETLKRAGHPAGPAAAASRHVRRRVPRRAGRHAEHARHHADQTERPERAQCR